MKLFPVRPMLWAAGACALTVVCATFGERYSIPVATAIPAFLLLAVLTAWRAGFRASLTVAGVATLCLDYFLTEPRHSFEIASARDIVTLMMFGASAILVSQLSHRIHVRNDEIEHAREQQTALYEFSKLALLVDWTRDVEEQLAKLLFERLALEGVGLYNSETQHFALLGTALGARDRIDAAFRARRGYDLPTGSERLRILEFGSRHLGALLLRGEIDKVLADSLCTLMATHLVRTRAVQSEVKAQSDAFSERLRSAVLDGLAHAIKTPLTTIIVSSSGLREVGPLSTLQDQLATTIESQAEHLAIVTNTLLRTAELTSDSVRVKKALVDLAEFGLEVKGNVEPHGESNRVCVDAANSGFFLTDARLLALALQQLLENALKYSPAGSPVTLSISTSDTSLTISVHNEGSFIPLAERKMIFERYYRGASTVHKASGTGIGLSVAQSAIRAMGGSISLDSGPDHGTTFHITLPGGEES